MSDAATKNLHVPELVAAELKSDHIPYHLLCKAHTCEKLDECNVKTLMDIERVTGLKDIIETREPQLVSFTRQSKSIVCKAVINALLTLVATGGDGKSVSLADDFSLILEEDGVHKKYSLYKERRFTRLGYTAASIFECLPQFKKLLDRTSKKNLLVRACRLYIESDLIRAALKPLGYFTYTVTMPFINAIVKCDQNELVTLLPKLFEDLNVGKADCLRQYRVEWKHVDTKKLEPTSDLDILLTQKMLKDAASGVQLQCAREYWEGTDKPRATQIFKLTSEERENLPTENLEPERYMNRVGSLAGQSAAHSNRFFKAKRMRDDLMFSTKPNDFSPEESSWSSAKRQIFKRLDAMESVWTSEQRELYKQKLIKAKIDEDNSLKVPDILLAKCKKHNGPVTNMNELHQLIANIPKEKELISALRLEIQYRKAVYPKDAERRSELYRVNSLALDQRVINLTELLSDETDLDSPGVLFQTEDEIVEVMKNIDKPNELPFKPLEPLVVVWDDENGGRNWYLGFFMDCNKDKTFRVDHLERFQINLSSRWRRPVSDDVQDVEYEQIVSCTIQGNWTMDDDENPIFILLNEHEIQEKFCAAFLCQ